MLFMPDTMVFDFIVETPGLLDSVIKLAAEEQIEILTTWVQEEQLAAAPTEKQALFATVPRREVGPGVFVLGVSRIGVDRLGPSEPYEHVRGDGGNKHVSDAMIAATASMDDAILVTNDGRLTRRATHQAVAVMNTHAFRLTVLRLTGVQPGAQGP
jgi:hypothetical protein